MRAAVVVVPLPRGDCLGDIKLAFAKMTYLRTEMAPPAPFEESTWTKADRVHMERRYRQLGHSISDQATEFLKANGFRPGGLKKLK
jgi:hypothetical protein